MRKESPPHSDPTYDLHNMVYPPPKAKIPTQKFAHYLHTMIHRTVSYCKSIAQLDRASAF